MKSFSIVGLAASAALGLMALPGVVSASLVSCPGDNICNGNDYAVTLDTIGGNAYEIRLDLFALESYTGNKWTDSVLAVQLKGFAEDISDVVLTSAPELPNDWEWSLNGNELNANGCGGGSGGAERACSESEGQTGAAFTQGDVLTWLFSFNASSINDTAHLKYLYVDESGNKVGDLGSFDMSITQVPAPGTLALWGAGLLALGAAARRRRSH